MSTQVIDKPAEIKTAAVTVAQVKAELNATNEQVALWCKLCIAGQPTAKTFPSPMGEMVFTEAQRAKIKEARTTHRRNARQNKAKTIAFLKGKKVHLTAVRQNATNEKGRIGWIHESAFARKTKAATANAMAKFFGDKTTAPAAVVASPAAAK